MREVDFARAHPELTVLLTEAQRKRVVACRDATTLERWLHAAATAATAAAVVFRAVTATKAKRPSKTR